MLVQLASWSLSACPRDRTCWGVAGTLCIYFLTCQNTEKMCAQGAGCNKMGSLSCSLENILRWGCWCGIWWPVAHFAALSYLLLCLAPAQALQRTHIAFTLPLSTWCESREHLGITEKVLSSELPRKSLRTPRFLPSTLWDLMVYLVQDGCD